MLKMFPEDGEEDAMFVARCKKFSRHNIRQERTLILSTHRVYLLSGSEIHGIFEIKYLKYIVKSKKSSEFLLYFTDE